VEGAASIQPNPQLSDGFMTGTHMDLPGGQTCIEAGISAKVYRAKRKIWLMAKAIWNGKVVAESETYETVEGNVYFPESSIRREYFRPSSTISTCPWKGQARYYTLLVDGQENQDAAWYYPDPKPAARNIKNHIAFWRGVEIEK
jgi:uncharacterized protein (DUF427 family)